MAFELSTMPVKYMMNTKPVLYNPISSVVEINLYVIVVVIAVRSDVMKYGIPNFSSGRPLFQVSVEKGLMRYGYML